MKAIEIQATKVGVETDQGGDLWRILYKRIIDDLISEGVIRRYQAPKFDEAKAGAGYGNKVHRNDQMRTAYELGNIVHVIGTHGIIESALNRFPSKPLDLADAMYWSWYDLTGGVRKAQAVAKDQLGKVQEDDRESDRLRRSQAEIAEMIDNLGDRGD